MKKPNVIFILIDDLGWKDLTCYGSDFYETPNIDSLARRGMRFTDAYAACPVCSPTRASILTGKYPARVGITDWIDWEGHIHPARGRLIDVPYLKELTLTERTLAHALKDSGYATWHVGKWHLGGPGHYPENTGFDVNVVGCEKGSPGRGGYFSPWSTIPALADADVPEGTYLTDYMGDRAAGLIEGQDPDEPFFLSMWFYTVHTPIQGKPEYIEKYERKIRDMGLDTVETFAEGNYYPVEFKKEFRIRRRLVQSDAVYAAMIESLDENVGKIVAALERTGRLDDTIIFFTSDNGGLATSEGSPTCNAPLSEGKGWMYEGGVREPLLAVWPGITEAGSVSGVPVTSPDFYPTILEMTGCPPVPEQHVDGRSFVQALQGDASFDRGPVFWHYPHYGNQGGTPGASVRDGDWKLIRFFEDGHEELYNLRRDIGETTNLADSDPKKRAELSAKLTAWSEEIEALIPETNPEYVPWAEREASGHFAAESSDGADDGRGSADPGV